MTANNPGSVYSCINFGEAFCPSEIENRSICLDEDIGKVFEDLLERK